MNYYRIKTGYIENDFVSISENDLHKVQYLFLMANGRTLLENGSALRGQDIISITPDVHKIMGWNRTYKLTPEDHAESSPKLKAAHKKMVEAKDLAYFIQREKKTGLLQMPMHKAYVEMLHPLIG